jgi:hypothetical protein
MANWLGLGLIQDVDTIRFYRPWPEKFRSIDGTTSHIAGLNMFPSATDPIG